MGPVVEEQQSWSVSRLRAFVISGNLGQPDTLARYDLPPAEIQRYVADFIAGVSTAP